MKSSIFQIAVLGAFGIFILVGVLVFAFFRSNNTTTSTTVTIWGTIPSAIFNAFLAETSLAKSPDFKVAYLEKEPENFSDELVEAILEGQSPDLLLLSQESILEYVKKVLLIPYKSYPERSFKDTFIQGAEIYLMPDGIAAMPLFVDPLVMYWNRDIFTNAGIVTTPKYWDEFYDLAAKLTIKNTTLDIEQSAFGLGEFANISNAKEIIATLMMQAGSSLVERKNKTFVSILNEKGNNSVLPAVSALNFYTQFADPSKTFYSWSRSLPNSLQYFLSGNLAMYFGFGSELDIISKKNPNLNFDVALLPQSRDGKLKIVFGKMQGLAVAKFSKNPAAAVNAAIILTGAGNAKLFTAISNFPPARRDLLTQVPTNAFSPVFYSSSLISRAWLDPDKAQTSEFFKKMVENVTSGRSDIAKSVRDANAALSELLLGLDYSNDSSN